MRIDENTLNWWEMLTLIRSVRAVFSFVTDAHLVPVSYIRGGTNW